MKNKQESLVEEITFLNEHINQLRKLGKDYSQETQELIRLILELDGIEQDNEIKKYDADGS